MKKLKSTIYNKMLIQAEEAKFQGFEKLASDIFQAVGALPDDEEQSYSKTQLENDIESDLWKLATNVLNYHNIDSVNVEKLDDVISELSELILEKLEGAIEAKGLSEKEPMVIGEENVFV